ncbi:MAG: magnesium transporter [Ignavibacteria bacterium]
MIEPKPKRAVIEVDTPLLNDIRELIESGSMPLLKNILSEIYPPDIALIINNLPKEDGLELFKVLPVEISHDVLLEMNEYPREFILSSLSIPETASLISEMNSNDAADIIGWMKKDSVDAVLKQVSDVKASNIRELLSYGKNTAGGIMQKEFVDVKATDTVKEAIEEIKKEAPYVEQLYHVWVTDEQRRLLGIVSLKKIILSIDSQGLTIGEIMNSEVISVDVNTDQEEVARVFRKYDLVSIPVVDANEMLVGRISVDDVVDVIEEEYSEDVAKIVGSDAEELESKSPIQIAWMRLPWVLITLGIELLAGLVIKLYDDTLGRILLLASFMPIISAISGNTGLQAATITVRALATGHATLTRWWEPIKRSTQTSLIIGFACGIVIGIIAGLWYGKSLFGLLVGFSMFTSINISGLVGTSVPMLSKRLGFDPAITAGPFETAFQDVVGISIFLSLATLLIKWLL